MKSKKLNHVAAGLLASFVSRNNDVDGYWAPGVLYREAAVQGHATVLDLLTPAALAPSPSVRSVVQHYAPFLRHALDKQGLAQDGLVKAQISILFDVAEASQRAIYGKGDIFACSVMLADRHGNIAQRTVHGRCRPHTPGAFTRSARARPVPGDD
jgi:hypothetical protein